MDTIKGGCSCGALRITATGAPNSVGVCHCLDCRKHHGAPFYAAAAFEPTTVTITGKSATHKGRTFCPTCGSSVYASEDGEVEIHLGALDEPNQLTPTYELWTIRRENWLQPIPNAKQYKRGRTN
jgi:hypothetical protein